MKKIQNFDDVVAELRRENKLRRVAMVCPADSHTEYVVKRSLEEGIADFILFCHGECKPEFERLQERFADRVTVSCAATPDDAAREAVASVRRGDADVLMKGTINTDNLLRAVLDKQCGLLEPGRVLSHVTVAVIPSYPKMLVFSDAAVVPRPTFEQFEAILGYTVDTCRRIGVDKPRVALLHCTEKINEKFPHTISYEEIKRRAAENRYGDIYVGGPMDVKTACDAESGRLKGIVSPVVGQADALIFPNIESGNVFYKTVTLFANAEMAGMLCGTSAPVVVASRADSCESKFYSLALACVNIAD